MKKKINYKEISDKFRTEEQFKGSTAYILELYDKVTKLAHTDMDKNEKLKEMHLLNKEASRINKMSRAFLKEIKNKKAPLK